jgi:hypothetical protein
VNDRRWFKLGYKNPLRYLIEMQDVVIKSGILNHPSSQKILNDRKLRPLKEDRRCAIFCYGLGITTNSKIVFSSFESSDYDYVLCIEHNNNKWLVPLQMKQLVSAEVNPSASIQSEINKLKKYADSKNLVVAIHINRFVEYSIQDLDFSELNIGELWFFGNFPEDKYKWRIHGNILSANPKELVFQLPKT